MTDKRKILEVRDAFNGFYLYHNPSGQCACMGDGVDMRFYAPRLNRIVSLADGEDVFTEAWQADVDGNSKDWYFEAYFHDLWELEVYKAPSGAMEQRLYVVTRAIPVSPSMVRGLYVWVGEQRYRSVAIYECELSHGYTLVAYTDLSYDEQAAIAAALDECEEAT